MNDPKITAEICFRISQRQTGLRISGMEAWLLDTPDKVDPFNMCAVLAVMASVNGRPGAWVVETRNDPGEDIRSRLIDGAVDEIIANPSQDQASASSNRRTVS